MSLATIRFTGSLAAFSHRNYRLWFIGQLTSLVGTWMQNTAQGYLVFDLTKDPAYLGYVAAAAGAPQLLLMLFGGALVDRVSRRKVILATQISMMFLASILSTLVFSGQVQPWHILVMAFFLGVANAFDAPARQAFVVELVGREDMPNAIALNSTMFNSATVLGPIVAALTYAAYGPAWCFTINALSFIAVIIALLMMKLPPHVPAAKTRNALGDIADGLRYTRREPVIRILVMSMIALSVFGFSVVTLIPAWAVNILHGDVKTNGLLITARGLGAVGGAIIIAAISHRHVKGKIWTLGSLVFPVALLGFALARWLPLSVFFLVLVGWGWMSMVNTSNAIVQHIVPDHLRGRVMSIFTLTFFGFMPVGSLIAGQMAGWISEPITVIFGASLLALYFLGVWLERPDLRKLA